MLMPAMTLMPRRLPREAHLILLGRWVCAQAALGKLKWSEVPKAYRESGGTWPPSADVQSSKLGVFWRFGRKFGKDGVMWLEDWQPHRLPGHSTYSTLIGEMRDKLKKGKL